MLRVLLLAAAAFFLVPAGSSGVYAMNLEEAIQAAIQTNPTIGQAIHNRRAIEWEMRQARGLYLPRLDLQASAGLRSVDSLTPRTTGIAGGTSYPYEAGLVLRQPLFDGMTNAEVEHQASRVDGASIRIDERVETISLDVTLTYHEVILQEAVIKFSQENIGFHEGLLADIVEGTVGGTLTIADQRQAEERLYAAQARLTEAQEALEGARIRFERFVGLPIGETFVPRSMAEHVMPNIEEAMAVAAANNQTLILANADIDAAQALREKARADFMPKVFLETRIRGGKDIDGIAHRTSDFSAMIVAQWNLYNGGIRQANTNEQVWRVGEQWNRFYDLRRSVEQEVRLSWIRRDQQRNLISVLEPQVESNIEVVDAYRDQFMIGRRSLLDLLNTQNTLYNSRVLLETARSAISFAEYRIMAAAGKLVSTLGLTIPSETDPYGRGSSGVPPTPEDDSLPRRLPPAPEGLESSFFDKL